jgi:probable F420-dependent oxidoreductase
LILPQRQTVLAAQQTADADLLSGGRLRIGVGTGWNWVEYDALNEDFTTRGKRLDEQIVLLRELWTEPLVTFEGRFHQLDRCCINPRPTRSIPIWVGGFSEPAFSRAARLGDGFTFAGDQGDAIAGMVRVRELLVENGRGDADFGFEYTLTRARDVASVLEATERWQEAGGNGVSVLTQKIGFDSVAAHIDYLAEVKPAVDARFGS